MGRLIRQPIQGSALPIASSLQKSQPRTQARWREKAGARGCLGRSLIRRVLTSELSLYISIHMLFTDLPQAPSPLRLGKRLQKSNTLTKLKLVTVDVGNKA